MNTKKGYKLVPWLFGKEIEIPEEWDNVIIINSGIKVLDGDRGNEYPKESDFSDTGYCLFLSAKNVTKMGFLFTECLFISKEKDQQLRKGCVSIGDIIITTRGTVGNIGYFDHSVPYKNIRINSGMAILQNETDSILQDYFYHLLKSPIIVKQLRRLQFGSAQPQLTIGTINQLNILVPLLPEQQKIASILSNIDSLIDSTSKIIKNSKSLKTGLMQKLLTRGIGHTKFKKVNFHFGIILKIPEEWKVGKLKEFILKIGSGVTPKGGSSVYLPKGIPLIRSQNVHFEGLSLDNVAFISKEIHNDMKNTKLIDNDVLLNITGASIGRCTYVPTNFGEGNVNQHVCIIRTKSVLFHTFLSYFLSSNLLQNIIQSSQAGLSREGLNFKEIGDFIFPLPPLPEQQKIASILSNIDTQINSQTQYKEKLERLKKSLMQKLLTGEVRVAI